MDLPGDALVITVIVAEVAVVVAVMVVALVRRTRSGSGRRQRLQERPGPEHDRTGQLRTTPLTPASRRRRTAQWQALQAGFVEVPAEAVDGADRLVGDVMAERGYPAGDRDERTQLLVAEHADTVEHHRTAEAHQARARSGEGTTEDLRQAFLGYRRVFDVLVEEGASGNATDAEGPPPGRTGSSTDDH